MDNPVMHNDGALARWLLVSGGPAIRYRTATEVLDSAPGVDVAQLAGALLASPMTQLWLERVPRPTDESVCLSPFEARSVRELGIETMRPGLQGGDGTA